MTDDERWHGGAARAEGTETSCASVMAEVWTFLDGECAGPQIPRAAAVLL